MKLRFGFWIAAALILGVRPLGAEAHVVRGDASRLPPPDMTRQIERKTADGFQKAFSTKVISTGAVEGKAWNRATPAISMKTWSGGRDDFYARSLDLGAFERDSAARGAWLKGGEPWGRLEAMDVSPSAWDGRASEIRPRAIPAEAVELPGALSSEDARAKFRVTPVVITDSAGKKREQGRAAVAREPGAVRVGGESVEAVRAPPGTSAPRTPSASP